jgi:hypothetical protein
MRPYLAPLALLVLAGCGGGQGDSADKNILNATAQMDPAAAAAVQNAVQNGANPQEALAAGGQAQVGAPDAPSAAERGQPIPPPVQARPNLPGSPNRKDGTVPPDKMISNGQQTGVAGSQNLPQER